MAHATISTCCRILGMPWTLILYKHIVAKLLILELGPMYSSYLVSQSYELCIDDLI
jgi:hypothetical protein